MAWALSICEGRSYDIMVRSAELTLALQQFVALQATFEKNDSYSPWRHLISPPQQVALRALALDLQDSNRNVKELVDVASQLKEDRNAGADAYREATEKMRQGYIQPLWARSGDSVPPRPPPATWLVLVSDAGRSSSATLARYERVYGFAPFGGAPHEVSVLPLAVDRGTFQAGATAVAGQVLLIGSGNIPDDRLFMGWLTDAGAQRIIFFDPYLSASDYQASAPLPSSVVYVDQGAAAERAAAYAGCCAAVVRGTVTELDNHFLWEAAAMGVPPLGNFLPAAGSWSAEQCKSAWQALQQGASPRPVPDIVDWSAIPPLFEAALMAAPAATRHSTAPTYRMQPHRVAQFRSFEKANAEAVRAATGSKAIALLSPGDTADYTPEVKTFLQRYEAVFCDIQENAEFIVPLVTNRLPSQEFNVGDVMATCQDLLTGDAPLHIDIIHLGDSNERIFAVKSALDGLFDRWRATGSKTVRVPRVVIHVNKRYEGGSLSRRQIGVSVATDAIVGGIELDAQGRYTLQWLGKQGYGSERGRVYLYPFHGAVGFDGDEMDYSLLPHMLARNEIDLLCSVDPFLVGGVAARTLWAKKSVPVVGMLHSIHSAGGATEVIFQLLTGSTFPFDAVISPSRCGADAYAGLFAAASEWLGRTIPAPPHYQGRLEVIPYGIDASYYHGLDRASCRGALGVAHDAIVLVSVGRFNKQEKADLLPLLLAVKELRRRHPKVVLILAGGRSKDPYPDKLRNMAQNLEINDCVTLRENIGADDKILLYGAADIFVTISDNIQETYGLTLLEAMAAGKPVVASGWNGYREIVRHGQTGFLVPTFTVPPPNYLEQVQRIAESIGGYGHRDLHESVVVEPQALVHYLEQLISQPELCRTMGQEGQRICSADYDQLKQARKTGDLLLELIAVADKTPWAPAPNLVPFADPVHKRFAHYPSAGQLSDSDMLTVGQWGHDSEVQQVITRALDINSRSEQSFMTAILKAAGDHPTISMGDLAAALVNDDYDIDIIRPRIARCLKYGLLSVVQKRS